MRDVPTGKWWTAPHHNVEPPPILADADIVASADAFVRAFTSSPRAATIQPGVYAMANQMSAAEAVARLLDPAARAEISVTIVEGFTKQQVIERLAANLNASVEDVTAAAEDAEAIGLPPEANGDIEGWIAPLTYQFAPDATPADALAEMIATRVAELDRLEIPADERERLITIASIVEREVNFPEYYGQVARVVENRLAGESETRGLLQMDSTVLYGVGKTGGIPTAEDLANDNPYNTYINPGLPPTPISNPSFDVMSASMNPPEGNWLYFVTVNLDTGETKFASTLDEHNQNVAEFRAWVEANPADEG